MANIIVFLKKVKSHVQGYWTSLQVTNIKMIYRSQFFFLEKREF